MNNCNIKITLSTSRYMLNHFKKYQLPNKKKQEEAIQVKILKEYVGKVRHNSTTLQKDRKSNSALNTPEIICYSTQHNLSNKRQFDPSSIFSPYPEFYNSKLHEVSFI
jgi:hypothetical protein